MATETVGVAQAPVQSRAALGLFSTRKARKTAAFYVFIAPWLIGFLLLGVIPMVLGFLTSLTNYDGLNLDSLKFVGLRNYERILSDSDAMFGVTRTLAWSALNVPVWLIGSFLLALILDQAIRAKGMFRTLFYLPSVIPLVAIVSAWRIFLDTNNGLMNAILSIFQPNTAINWFSSDYSLQTLTLISVWTGLGGGMVIFLAGLQGIPSELKEAAQIDGATNWKVIRHVTLPLMTPVIFFQLVLALISSFQQFIVPMVMAGGKLGSVPPRSTYLYMIHVNRQIFTFQRFGYGIAMLWVLFVVIVAFTIIVFWSARYWVYYETDLSNKDA